MTTAPAWTWAQTAAVIVPFVAILGAVLVWYLGQQAARRDRRAAAFAAALAAIEKYAEFPYRVRRRAATAEARHALADVISETQSEIAFHQLWLDLEAPGSGASYRHLVRAARVQAGQQMMSAWLDPVISSDAEMNLGVAYPRDQIDAAREACAVEMARALRLFGGLARPSP